MAVKRLRPSISVLYTLERTLRTVVGAMNSFCDLLVREAICDQVSQLGFFRCELGAIHMTLFFHFCSRFIGVTGRKSHQAFRCVLNCFGERTETIGLLQDRCDGADLVAGNYCAPPT